MYKPKIILLVDYPNWAFDHIARSMAKRLRHNFDFDIKYVGLNQKLDAKNTDLIHVFFWGESHYKQFSFQKDQIIKEVASLRWKYEEGFGYLSTEEFVQKYLADCSCVVTPAVSICKMLEGHVQNLFHLPNGVEANFFRPPTNPRKSEKLTIGWVGNPKDLTKGLLDILIPATAGYNFLSTDGQLSRYQLSEFYKQIDVLAIASIAESQPLPLLESMSAGGFPVTTNVGIVPEIIVNRSNGLIVERNIESFKNAFEWCNQNLQTIRQVGFVNRDIAKSRSWDECVKRFEEIYRFAFEKRLGRPSDKVSVFVSFPTRVSQTSNNEGLTLSQSLGNKKLVLSEAWSRFWLGDIYKAGYSVRISRATVGLARRVLGKIKRLLK
jgi:glycosyltransferase involved in cell wall biosynthesis